MKHLCVILIGLIVGATSLRAHDGKGGIGLEPDPSVHALALGSISLAETGTIEGFQSNPSCLPHVGSLQISFKHGGLVENLNASTMGFVAGKSFGRLLECPGKELDTKRLGLGIALKHRAVELAEGSDWSCETIFLGFGYAFAPYVSFGMTTKLLFSTSDLNDVSASGYGLDIGTRIELNARTSVGLVLRNIAGRIAWKDAEDERPPFILASSATLNAPYGTRFNLGAEWLASGESRLGLGVESPAYRGLEVELGFLERKSTSSRTIFTGGFGFTHKPYTIRYAFQSDSDAFGLSHHFSITFITPY